MLSKKVQRAVGFLTVAVILIFIIVKRRSSGLDYEVPDFKRNQLEGETGRSSHLEFDPFDEIRSLLIKSPVVIFSKSYCPHSRFVKTLLSEEYKMVPPPTIKELDLHPHGSELQDALLEISGRRTVPNVFVGGESLGGGDEMRLLHGQNQLVQAFKKNAGRRFRISKVNKN
ncbi:thioredoxin-like protein [Lipomyces tetrasporus]|uniref:Thioredoxin-like protein n=1 Tax=Lipomyces tetrasporus TaxID=54092 RepID=A0AAD7QN23_9ASCO|nr:thioredoxin-like protein [Lipomyces tetrasporus]KAJ8097911.1 thioredoxin-like protein [Lipomyces tetrasporus]